MSLWSDRDFPELTVEMQKDIAKRLGLTEQEVKDDPYKLRKKGINFLLSSPVANAPEVTDLSTNEIVTLRKGVRTFLAHLR